MPSIIAFIDVWNRSVRPSTASSRLRFIRTEINGRALSFEAEPVLRSQTFGERAKRVSAIAESPQCRLSIHQVTFHPGLNEDAVRHVHAA